MLITFVVEMKQVLQVMIALWIQARENIFEKQSKMVHVLILEESR